MPVPMESASRILCSNKGPREQLLSDEVSSQGNKEDYLRVILTDEEEIIDPMGKIRSIYPNVMALDFENVKLFKFIVSPLDCFAVDYDLLFPLRKLLSCVIVVNTVPFKVADKGFTLVLFSFCACFVLVHRRRTGAIRQYFVLVRPPRGQARVRIAFCGRLFYERICSSRAVCCITRSLKTLHKLSARAIFAAKSSLQLRRED